MRSSRGGIFILAIILLILYIKTEKNTIVSENGAIYECKKSKK